MADGLADLRVAPDHAEKRRRDVEEGLASAQQRAVGPLAAARGVRHVDDHPHVHVGALTSCDLDEGVGVGERGRLVGGDDDARPGDMRQLAPRPIDAGGANLNRYSSPAFSACHYRLPTRRPD